MTAVETCETSITIRLIDAIQRTADLGDVVEPRVEVEMLVLDSVLHGVARGYLLLMLRTDNEIPLGISS